MKFRSSLLVIVVLIAAALTLPFSTSAQDFVCGSLSASDCQLIQTALANLASVSSLEFSGSVSQSAGFSGLVTLEIRADFSGFAQFGPGGEVTALDVVINPASVSMGGMFSLPPMSGAAGVRIVDDVLYIGTGSSAAGLTWSSLDLTNVALNRSFADSSPIPALGSNQNWQRLGDVEAIPGIMTTVFEAVGAVDPEMLGDLGSLAGSSSLGDLGSLLGDLTSTMQLTQTGRLLVEPGTQLLRGMSVVNAFDLGDMAAVSGLDILGQSDMGNGGNTTTEILFRNFNVDHAFSAPAGATPMSSSQISAAQAASGGGGLGTFITAYFITESSTIVGDALDTMDPTALVGSLLGGMDSNALGGLLGGMDTNALGGLLGGMMGSTGSSADVPITARGAISVGQTMTGNLVAGTSDQWTLTLTAGQNVQINMDADFDTVLELNGPDGLQVAFNDDFNGLDSQITYQAAAAGTYTIIARSFGNASSGPYTLTVAAPGTPTGGSLSGAATTTGSLSGAATTTGSLSGSGQGAVTVLTCFDNAQIPALSGLGVGQTAIISCPASCSLTAGSVWGSRIYTDDSSICRAAIHAGVMTDQGGQILLTIAPGQQSYAGSTQNGITTSNWGSWSRSFTVAAPPR